MSIIRLDACTLQELVKHCLDIHETAKPNSGLWYRGINCLTYDLIPKIMRDSQPSETVYDRERRLLTRFRQRSLAYWPAGYPQDDWEHLFAMQHYGLPTRLLDWSENLFVAAFFALTTKDTHTHQGPCIPAIWCIDPVKWNRTAPSLCEHGDTIGILTTSDEDIQGYATPTSELRRRGKFPIAIYGTHNSNRIVAQRGNFVIWGSESVPLETYAEREGADTIWRISLTGDRSSLASDLYALGFNETMMFPELTHLATELTRIEGWRT